nr:MAG TPA: hypothetical protein [Caudoviricetes sp.]
MVSMILSTSANYSHSVRYLMTLIAIHTKSLLYNKSESISFFFQQEENPLLLKIC